MNDAAPAPWSRRIRLVLLVLNIAGAAAIVGGWVWASGETVFDDQFPATNVAIVGLMVATAGNLAWLLSGRLALARAKRAVFLSSGFPASGFLASGPSP